jgi:Uma2 family endonuclease
MATVAAANPTGPSQPEDLFRYGWRYVRHVRPDGVPEYEQVPLTLEDVLHPQEGDFIVHNERHERRNLYLYDVFDTQLADDPTAVVLHDVRIAWDIPGLGAHGPDIAVIFGVRERKNWSTFDVAREGVRPTLIVEVTSPETAAIDRSNKLEEYNLARVPLYIIINTLSSGGRSQLLLLGYIQEPSGYQVLAPNERGWLWLDPVRVWLGIADNEIVCYNEAGQPLGDYRALTATLNAEIAARIAAEKRATEEAEARATAEAQLRVLEAELRRLRGDAP